MFHLKYLLRRHLTAYLFCNISRTHINLSNKLFWQGLLATLSLMCHSLAIADTNVMGEEIIIYSDDTFKPAPRDLGPSDKTPSDKGATKKSGGNRLGDSFDTELHTNETQADNNDTQDQVTVSSDDLWQRIRNGYAMPESTSSLVKHHEEWYSSRPDYIKRMVERSQKYLFHIVEEVEKRGMPTEIALLPMIESAYNPQANSTSSASGIWQFVPSTGKHFGLKQNWWVDKRRDVTIATDAALTYLQKLYGMFGSWDLALAAYNAGEGTVGRAIERNRKLGLPTDYESLDLPAETKNYVPKLQAIKNLMTNPENYGLKIQTIANTPYFAKVSAPAQIDAHLAAKLAEISDEEFLALNPSNKRPVITSNGDKHELLLPIMAAQTFRSNLAGYDKPLVSWRTYFAKRGERMENIASKFGIQLSQLRDVNNLPSQNKIKNSATILVPNGNKTDYAIPKTTNTSNVTNDEVAINDDISAKQDSANIDINNTDTPVESNDDKTEPVKIVSVTHKVKRGDTIQSIAKHYDVSVKQIMASNSLKNYKLKAGQLIKVGTQSVSASATKQAPNKKLSGNNIRNKKNTNEKTHSRKTMAKTSAQSKSKANRSKVTTKKSKHH